MEPLKNVYTPAYIERLASAIHAYEPGFAQKPFVADVLDRDWPQRELKDRMAHISTCLRRHLPQDFRRAVEILLAAAPGFDSYHGMFFPEFIASYGLDDWETSLPALERLTQYSSSEFAVRPFILRDPQRMMAQMRAWASHPNYHVRRLASEGSRPRLPWAMALPAFKADPGPVLPILEQLRTDPELYVRRSVANNLNDITKDNPSLVLDLAESWFGQNPDTDWILRHACRSLLKRGELRALRLFGFDDPGTIELSGLSLAASVIRLGEELGFQFQVQVGASQKVRLEFSIDFVKSNGKTSPKIFQISEKVFDPGQYVLSRSYTFRDMTTRKHYPGTHGLTVLVNGIPKANLSFEVKH